MEQHPPSNEASLSAFIRANLESILQDWEQFAQSILSARHMPAKILRDHAGGMLLTIADEMECSQTALQQAEKAKGRAPRSALETEAERHGAARVAGGFAVAEAGSEFRALRASVLRQWSAARGAEQAAAEYQTIRFNEAIDQT